MPQVASQRELDTATERGLNSDFAFRLFKNTEVAMAMGQVLLGIASWMLTIYGCSFERLRFGVHYTLRTNA